MGGGDPARAEYELDALSIAGDAHEAGRKAGAWLGPDELAVQPDLVLVADSGREARYVHERVVVSADTEGARAA